MKSSNETGTRRGKMGLVGCGGVAINAEAAVVVTERLGTSTGACSGGSIVVERVELDNSDPDLDAEGAIVSDREGFDPGLGSRLS